MRSCGDHRDARMRTRSSEQEDTLLRLIQQLAAAARRLRELLTESADSSASVRVEVGQSIALVLGKESTLLSGIDAASAVRLVRSRARLEMWIALLELDADACDRGGLVPEAGARRARAAALRAAAVRSASAGEDVAGGGLRGYGL
jgi:hypothetical protein